MRRPSRWVFAVLLGGVLLPGASPAAEPTEAGRAVEFTVTVAGAKSVAVAGSFNGWSTTEHPMTPSRNDGTWSAVITLPAGEYKFMYVLDGRRWVMPQAADEFVDDGFGQINGVKVVR